MHSRVWALAAASPSFIILAEHATSIRLPFRSAADAPSTKATARATAVVVRPSPVINLLSRFGMTECEDHTPVGRWVQGRPASRVASMWVVRSNSQVICPLEAGGGMLGGG